MEVYINNVLKKIILLLICILSVTIGNISLYAAVKSELLEDVKLERNADCVDIKLEPKKKLENELEYSLWVNYNNTEWLKVEEDMTTSEKYYLTEPGVYAFQVNVRKKDDREVEEKIWIGDTIKQATLINSIEINNTQGIGINDKIHFKVNTSKELSSLEAEILIKNGDEEWHIASEYDSDNLQEFTIQQYGVTHIQLNIRDKSNPFLIQSVYVGEISLSEDEQLIKNMELKENRLNFNVGESINVIPVQNTLAVEELRYSVLVKYNDEKWYTIQENKKLPLEKICLEKEGILNICLKVQDPNNNNKYQITPSIQIYISKFYPDNVENLLRILASNYSFFKYNSDEIISSLAKELNVLGYLFIYEDNKEEILKHLEQIEKIIPIINKKEAERTGVIEFDNPKGMLKKIDTNRKYMLYNKQYIDYRLEEYPTIKEILKNMSGYTEGVKMGAICTHLVYNHYQYNNIPGGNEKHNIIFSMDGHCLQLSDLLYQLMEKMNYAVRQITYDIGPDGGHSIVEFIDNKQLYVLDSTYNVIYPRGIMELEKDNSCIILPQIFDRHFLLENDACRDIGEVYIWKSHGNWEEERNENMHDNTR